MFKRADGLLRLFSRKILLNLVSVHEEVQILKKQDYMDMFL